MSIESPQGRKEDAVDQEGKPEQVPSEAEVRGLLMEFIGNAEWTERRKLEDTDGLYLLELVVKRHDGGTTEYQYQRKGRFPGRERQEAKVTRIDSVTFDVDGFSVGGGPLLYLNEDGVWASSGG